jgi:regulator of sirC expression with transglutaminase-like and TPR domain
MSLPLDLQKRLSSLSQQSDKDFDLLEASFVVSKVLRPSQDIDNYKRLAQEIIKQLHRNYKHQLTCHPPLIAKVEALQQTMVDERNFRGEEDAFDDLEHLNLFNVLETGCGTALSLSILIVHCASQLGWTANTLNFPGYVLVRLDEGAERKIIDPFNQCCELDAFHLRQLAKIIFGADAELQPDYYKSITRKALAMRLVSAVKYHFLRCEQMGKALEMLEIQIGLEPQSAAFWRETGLLQARLNDPERAIQSLETSIDLSDDMEAIQSTRHIIEDLRKKNRT